MLHNILLFLVIFDGTVYIIDIRMLQLMLSLHLISVTF